MELCVTAIICLMMKTGISFGFQVTGSLHILNTTDLTTLTSDDVLVFNFSLQLDLDRSNQRVLVSVAGDTLGFSNETQDLDWSLSQSSSNISFTRDSSELDSSETTYFPSNREDSCLAYLLNISQGLSRGEWFLTGGFRVLVSDAITTGSIIRSVMTITVLWPTMESSTETVSSNYIVIPRADVTVRALSALTQPIMGLFSAQVTLDSTRDLQGCGIHVYTSPEDTSKEVRLTVQRLQVSTNQTTGTTPETMATLASVVGSKVSSLGSYQKNMAFMALPRVPLDLSNHTQLFLASDCTVRVEDYSDLQSGDEWPVDMAVNFLDNILWLGSIQVNISAPKVRLPDLEVKVQQGEECAYDGNSTAVLQVLAGHTSSSTGTAYNVTVNLYLPDYMVMRRQSYTTPLENTITVSQEFNVIVVEIGRLTFSDPFTLEVTLDLNLTSLLALTAADRIVTVEAVYGDRWGHVTDILSNTVYQSVHVSPICSKRLRWAMSRNCQCVHNPALRNCACCVEGACQCGAVRPQACTPCQETWRCVSYKPGFEDLTYLPKSDLTEFIRCDAFRLRRGSATGSSCQKVLMSSPQKYLELSPRVGVVTGLHRTTGFLYGISNNGLAYVISRDGGNSWITVPDQAYVNVTSDPQFTKALTS